MNATSENPLYLYVIYVWWTTNTGRLILKRVNVEWAFDSTSTSFHKTSSKLNYKQKKIVCYICYLIQTKKFQVEAIYITRIHFWSHLSVHRCASAYIFAPRQSPCYILYDGQDSESNDLTSYGHANAELTEGWIRLLTWITCVEKLICMLRYVARN